MAQGNSSAGGGSASCSTEQTGNVATLRGGFSPSGDRIATEEERRDIVHEAAFEVDAIAEHLMQLERTVRTTLSPRFEVDSYGYLVRALCMRVKVLACLQMSAMADMAETARGLTRRLSGDEVADDVSNEGASHV